MLTVAEKFFRKWFNGRPETLMSPDYLIAEASDEVFWRHETYRLELAAAIATLSPSLSATSTEETPVSGNASIMRHSTQWKKSSPSAQPFNGKRRDSTLKKNIKPCRQRCTTFTNSPLLKVARRAKKFST